MSSEKKLLSHLQREEDIKLGERILDLAGRVQERNNKHTTKFLNPRETKIAEKILAQLADINYLSAGGHDKAERKRVIIFPAYLFPEHQNVPLSCFKIKGNFDFVNIGHGDFLGALTGLGIKREMIGDIILYRDTAQVVAAPEVEKEILYNLEKVNEVPVEVEKMECDEIIFEEKHRKEIKTSVASQRLDAVLSAGFGDSRSDSKAAIEEGRIKLNWVREKNPAAEVSVGDLISVKGRGRLKIVKKRGISNSGRIKLQIDRIT